MSIINGRVQSVRHNTSDFYIFAVEVLSSEQPRVLDRVTTVKGHLPGLKSIRAGVPIQLLGEWVTHAKYGRQFSLHGWRPWPMSSRGVAAFLQGCIEGFADGPLVDALTNQYGVNTLTVLGEEPDRVLEDFSNGGFSREVLEDALLAWDKARASYELTTLLQSYDVPSHLLKAILEHFGTEARSIIEENPYRLLSVPGFSFARVDTVARSLGVSVMDSRRYEGAILWVLREAVNQGHLYVRRQNIAKVLVDLVRSSDVVGFEISDLDEQLQAASLRLQANKIIQLDPEAGIYLPQYYRFERDSAKMLTAFMTPMKLDVAFEEFLNLYEKQHQIDLSKAQRDAVEKLLSNKVLVLTGSPGTGKTTTIRTFVSLFTEAGLNFRLMAPTGIAAKRLEAVTGHPAATIHRSFGYDGVSWGYGGTCKFAIDAVIVDECSMVDQELFFRILDALGPETMLVFVGDDAQLPSVGPGSVLRELINCSAIPTVRLTEIFRQSKASEIVVNAHKINRGETLQLTNPLESEFQFISIKDEDKLVDFLVQMAAKLKARDANFQILSPKYDGTVGVNHLNECLREQLNPSRGQPEVKIGDFHAREGDRLMVIQNNYEKNVYNGDMGKLVAIGRESLTVRVHGAGIQGTDMLVEFPKSEAVTLLRLAYAITVHKCQGSEFDTVILPVVSAQGRMLQRNLLYTAVTRAKKKVWLLGEPIALSKAIANDKTVMRNTALGKAIVQAAAEGVRQNPEGEHGNETN